MERTVLRLYGIATILFALGMLAMPLFGHIGYETGYALVKFNVANASIWFVINMWWRYKHKCSCGEI